MRSGLTLQISRVRRPMDHLEPGLPARRLDLFVRWPEPASPVERHAHAISVYAIGVAFSSNTRPTNSTYSFMYSSSNSRSRSSVSVNTSVRLAAAISSVPKRCSPHAGQ